MGHHSSALSEGSSGGEEEESRSQLQSGGLGVRVEVGGVGAGEEGRGSGCQDVVVVGR